MPTGDTRFGSRRERVAFYKDAARSAFHTQQNPRRCFHSGAGCTFSIMRDAQLLNYAHF